MPVVYFYSTKFSVPEENQLFTLCSEFWDRQLKLLVELYGAKDSRRKLEGTKRYMMNVFVKYTWLRSKLHPSRRTNKIVKARFIKEKQSFSSLSFSEATFWQKSTFYSELLMKIQVLLASHEFVLTPQRSIKKVCVYLVIFFLSDYDFSF